eukprot:TRINITY_DN7850_c0_g1_i2.p1 TRINITY_DN7850_c0_g1~~TRINITY_DN7850_c0_g1_i2.p1  ORF type:complete len:432 (+),score=28.08 TRINITY_DN7850_c0_g1_i2:196-1491(+)
MMEAGRQAPEFVHLVLDPTWILKLEDRLYLRLGYTFDSSGQCFFVEYAFPRPIHYFVNSFQPLAYTSYMDEESILWVQRSLDLERGYQHAMCGSSWLEPHIGDKILTRLLIRRGGVAVPQFIAFVPEAPSGERAHEYRLAQEEGILTIFPPDCLVNREAQRLLVQAKVKTFLDSHAWPEVVIKPSGGRFCGGKGVTFHVVERFTTTSEIHPACLDSITTAIMGLLQDMRPHEGVLLDERIQGVGPISHVKGYGDLDCCFRLHIARSSNNKNRDIYAHGFDLKDSGGSTSGILARFSTWGGPVAVCMGGFPETFPFYVHHAAIGTIKGEQLRHHIMLLGEKVLRALDRYFIRRRQAEGRDANEPPYAQIDFLGIDACVQYIGSEYVPVVVEVNDQEVDGMCYVDDLGGEENRGACVREYVRTAIARAKSFLP